MIMRLFWYTVALAIALCIVAGASWAIAYNTINDVLGAPPPDLGKSSTTFLWNGMPKRAGHPKAWQFTFGPTRIPGAPNVRFYVSPLGKLLQTDPVGLPALLKTMQSKGFN